jgi:hypothetical protein
LGGDMIKIINKDGTINKYYSRKIWNHVTQTAVDSFNGDMNNDEFKTRINKFRKMINKLVRKK